MPLMPFFPIASLACPWMRINFHYSLITIIEFLMLFLQVVIRQLLLTSLDDSHGKIRTAISMAVAAIGQQDWPEEWPELLPLLLKLISDQNNGNGGKYFFMVFWNEGMQCSCFWGVFRGLKLKTWCCQSPRRIRFPLWCYLLSNLDLMNMSFWWAYILWI